MLTVILTATEKQRIFSKITIDKKYGCWVWMGAKDKGYGVINFRGTNQKIHRLLYAVFIQPLPDYDGVHILDHIVCNNPSCCNPNHVKLVEQGFNVLRANSVSGINSRKIRCIHGHILPKASEPLPNGNFGRRCIICRNINKRQRYRAQKTLKIPHTNEFAHKFT